MEIDPSLTSMFDFRPLLTNEEAPDDYEIPELRLLPSYNANLLNTRISEGEVRTFESVQALNNMADPIAEEGKMENSNLGRSTTVSENNSE